MWNLLHSVLVFCIISLTHLCIFESVTMLEDKLVLSRHNLVVPFYLVSCVLYTDFLICLVCLMKNTLISAKFTKIILAVDLFWFRNKPILTKQLQGFK